MAGHIRGMRFRCAAGEALCKMHKKYLPQSIHKESGLGYTCFKRVCWRKHAKTCKH